MADQSTQFLQALFGGVENAYFLIWTLPGKLSRWFDDVADAAEAATTTTGVHVYVGMGLVRQPGADAHKRGGADQIDGITCLWFDLDIHSDQHDNKPVPANAEEARAFIETLPLPPSMIVDSGGGYHLYWILTEPWLFEGEEDRQRAADLALRWGYTISDLGYKEHKWSLDVLSDLSRVLRVPGTLNIKYTPPRPVSIIKCDPTWTLT
jgi:hypothetical protein